jgi:hypothetical protein
VEVRINVEYATRRRSSVGFKGGQAARAMCCRRFPRLPINLSLRMLWRASANFAKQGALSVVAW